MTGSVRLSVSLLGVIGILALAAPPAHAGGGMGGGPGASITTCRAVPNGTNEPQTVQIVDPLTVNGGDVLKIATLVLVCDIPASGTTVAGPKTTQLTAIQTNITCYTVSGADPSKGNATVTDIFGTQAVKLSSIQLVCVPANVAITP